MKDQIANQRSLAEKDGSDQVDMRSLKKTLAKMNTVEPSTGQQFQQSVMSSGQGPNWGGQGVNL
jgi:hypothetical protein